MRIQTRESASTTRNPAAIDAHPKILASLAPWRFLLWIALGSAGAETARFGALGRGRGDLVERRARGARGAGARRGASCRPARHAPAGCLRKPRLELTNVVDVVVGHESANEIDGRRPRLGAGSRGRAVGETPGDERN